MFFTGVMPVAWSDAFSSLDSVKDVSHLPRLQDTLGFKQQEIVELLQYKFPNLSSTERFEHLEKIKAKCNGHRRSPSRKEGHFNPQGVWFYLDQLKGTHDFGEDMIPRISQHR